MFCACVDFTSCVQGKDTIKKFITTGNDRVLILMFGSHGLSFSSSLSVLSFSFFATSCHKKKDDHCVHMWSS